LKEEGYLRVRSGKGSRIGRMKDEEWKEKRKKGG
jgi:hypothetical protein